MGMPGAVMAKMVSTPVLAAVSPKRASGACVWWWWWEEWGSELGGRGGARSGVVS